MNRLVRLALFASVLSLGHPVFADVNVSADDETTSFLVAVKAISPAIHTVLTDMNTDYAPRCARMLTIENYKTLAETAPGFSMAIAILRIHDADTAINIPAEYRDKYQESIQVPCDYFDAPPSGD